MHYKTKTKKRDALIAIRGKAAKLYSDGTIPLKDFDAILRIATANIKRL